MTTARTTVSVRYLMGSLGVLLTLFLSGCSITQLQHDELQVPDHRQSGVVNVADRATGFTGGRVGWGRITIFSIPVVPIHIHSDEAVDIMMVVSNSLTTAGYAPTLASTTQTAPILKAHINEVRFNNYTWIVPLVPTWGRINMTLRLESYNGQVLWEKSFEEKGNTLNFTDGYNIAATKIVTRLANSMVEAFTTQEFAEAVAD